MRIIAGDYKGRIIKIPYKKSLRPTKNAVKEALFGRLAHDDIIHGATVLDLFCGTGSLGLEALSRGANHVTFIDHDVQTMKYLFSTIKEWNIVEKSNLKALSVEKFIQRKPNQSWDILLCDPPYQYDGLDILYERFVTEKFLSKNGIFCLECSIREVKKYPFMETAFFQRKYGNTILSIFRPYD